MGEIRRLTAVILALVVFSPSCGREPADPEVQNSWLSDIAWISDSLPLLHYDLFMNKPRDSLIAGLSVLESQLGNLSDMETALELSRILASMECSHTGIAFWEQSDGRVYPLEVIWLQSGLYVTAISTEHGDLIGTRLLTYDGRASEEAASAMSRMFPATNSIEPGTRAERVMMIADCMHALGFGNPEEPVEFTFLTSAGDTVALHLMAVHADPTGMTGYRSLDTASIPMWLSCDDHYWSSFLPERAMLYIAYNSCTVMDGFSMDEFVHKLSTIVEEEEVTEVVVDLRRNRGGNSMVAFPLIRWLREMGETSDLRLSLIIGRWTYSSGILNAMEIAGLPGVRVYGERTGGEPNHLGEVRNRRLPYSGLPVSYPTKYFRTVDGPGETMVPDVEIPLAPEMLFEGRETVLDSISAYGASFRAGRE